MATVAQALKIFGSRKEIPVAAVRDDVIDIACRNTQAAARTFAAKWFADQLFRAKRGYPDRKLIPAAPC